MRNDRKKETLFGSPLKLNLAVKSNIGSKLFKLLNKHLPKCSELHRILIEIQ